jgi:hypothetical protein
VALDEVAVQRVVRRGPLGRQVVPRLSRRTLRRYHDAGPVDEDLMVLASGVVEIVLGAAFVVLPRRRRLVGALLEAFLVVVFPATSRSTPRARTPSA